MSVFWVSPRTTSTEVDLVLNTPGLTDDERIGILGRTATHSRWAARPRRVPREASGKEERMDVLGIHLTIGETAIAAGAMSVVAALLVWLNR